MGDVDFANDFSDELMKVLIELKELSKTTADDCIRRKHDIDNVFSGQKALFDDATPKELIELAG